MTLRVVIADDEEAGRARIRRLLRDCPDAEVVAECANGRLTIEAINRLRPDVAFLDVQMPEGDGFQVAAALSEAVQPVLVFVTAYDQYAVRAFDIHAVDYLLKPFDAERFMTAWSRVRTQVATGDSQKREDRILALLHELGVDGARRPLRYRDRFLIAQEGRSIVVCAAEVDWFEASGNYVTLHVGKAHHLVREPIGALASQLDPNGFARIHRGAIINLDRIQEVQPWFSGDCIVILTTGAKLRLTRSYRRAFETRFQSGPTI
jgi:two-component system LytT family response regulator